ncbi:MAG: leucine-rich repeat domain-containing protein [Eubacteriales bacterium]
MSENENKHLTSAERQKLYQEKATERRIVEYRKRQRTKYIKIALIAVAVVILIGLVVGIVMLNKYVWEPARIYESANELFAAEEYLDAYEVYISLGNYKDAAAIASTCITKNAQKLSGREDVIIGTGESMPWFKIDENGAITFDEDKYNGPSELTVPDVFDNRLVMAIGQKGFFYVSEINAIVLPPSIKRIEEHGFFNCDKLTEIVLPDYVEYIGDQAFENCFALKSVTFSKNLKQIGTAAFRNCDELTEITLPEGFETLGARAFSANEKLVSISFPSTVKTIGSKACEGDEKLEKVTYNGTAEDFALLCSGYGNEFILNVKEIIYLK